VAREYSVSGDAQTVVAAPQMTWLNPKASPSCAIELIRAWASQRANATSAQQGAGIGTKVTAFPTVVGVTPSATKLSDPVSLLVSGTGAAGTSGINSSANGGGTETNVVQDNFNVLNGWLWVPTPAETVVVGAGAASGIFTQFHGTPGTLTGWSFGCIFREVG
jgi:hypothetical protein